MSQWNFSIGGLVHFVDWEECARFGKNVELWMEEADDDTSVN